MATRGTGHALATGLDKRLALVTMGWWSVNGMDQYSLATSLLLH